MLKSRFFISSFVAGRLHLLMTQTKVAYAWLCWSVNLWIPPIHVTSAAGDEVEHFVGKGFPADPRFLVVCRQVTWPCQLPSRVPFCRRVCPPITQSSENVTYIHLLAPFISNVSQSFACVPCHAIRVSSLFSSAPRSVKAIFITPSICRRSSVPPTLVFGPSHLYKFRQLLRVSHITRDSIIMRIMFVSLLWTLMSVSTASKYGGNALGYLSQIPLSSLGFR